MSQFPTNSWIFFKKYIKIQAPPRPGPPRETLHREANPRFRRRHPQGGGGDSEVERIHPIRFLIYEGNEKFYLVSFFSGWNVSLTEVRPPPSSGTRYGERAIFINLKWGKLIDVFPRISLAWPWSPFRPWRILTIFLKMFSSDTFAGKCWSVCVRSLNTERGEAANCRP